MNKTSLDTISLHVTDVEKSIAFYSQIPGAEITLHRPGQFAEIHIGKGTLHVVQLPGPTRFHLELETDDLNGMHEYLRNAGLQPTTPTRHPWGKTDFKVKDPDGNLLEFSPPWGTQEENKEPGK
jgi:catechol 2,3-dioxygenase-like lactoylglutathione lyase family enzyme